MRKESAAQLVNEYKELMTCPICNSDMDVVELRSIVCKNNHMFDFAKQGYVNMLTRSVKSNYDKALFAARHEIIMKTHLYEPLHKRIMEIIGDDLEKHRKDYPAILDAGSGEGSHLTQIIDESNDSLIGVGVDLSKEGIRMAASKYHQAIWLVADLANIPVKDSTFHVILNILSPANYKEFKRVLSDFGLILKVVPGPNYLKELREAVFGSSEKKTYTNAETVSLFKEEFPMVNIENITYTKRLEQAELRNLMQMSPLSWSIDDRSKEELWNQESFEITIDLDILVGKQR